MMQRFRLLQIRLKRLALGSQSLLIATALSKNNSKKGFQTMTDSMSIIDEILGIDVAVQKTKTAQNQQIPEWDGDHLLRQSSKGHKCLDSSKTNSAAEAMPFLPVGGETLHVLMNGKYDIFDMINVVLNLSKSKIKAMHVATLGFNAKNCERLINMIESGKIGTATMIVSSYYFADKKEKDTCYRLAKELPRLGGWYCVARSHCKVIAIKMANGKNYTIESSANLRTCKNLEQFTITEDQGVFDFHAAWMKGINEQEEAKKADRQ